jgi:hypothetical protein
MKRFLLNDIIPLFAACNNPKPEETAETTRYYEPKHNP